jgi:hypothetical protein
MRITVDASPSTIRAEFSRCSAALTLRPTKPTCSFNSIISVRRRGSASLCRLLSSQCDRWTEADPSRSDSAREIRRQKKTGAEELADVVESPEEAIKSEPDEATGVGEERTRPGVSLESAGITSPGNDETKRTPRSRTLSVCLFQFRCLNYARFIDRAEVSGLRRRTFWRMVRRWQFVPLDTAGFAEWQPAVARGRALRELKYAVRLRQRGNFDETSAQSLWLVQEDAKKSGASEKEVTGCDRRRDGYGEALNSELWREHIRASFSLGSGTVKVRGSGVPPSTRVGGGSLRRPSMRTAILPPRKLFLTERTRWKWPCSIRLETEPRFSRSRIQARRLVLCGYRGSYVLGNEIQRTGRTAARRQDQIRLRLTARWSLGVLRKR